MKQEHYDNWKKVVTLLRSGQHEQRLHRLYTRLNGMESFCALGVAAVAVGAEGYENLMMKLDLHLFSTRIPEHLFHKYFGDELSQDEILELNDNIGASFEAIASNIEQRLKEVNVE